MTSWLSPLGSCGSNRAVVERAAREHNGVAVRPQKPEKNRDSRRVVRCLREMFMHVQLMSTLIYGVALSHDFCCRYKLRAQ